MKYEISGNGTAHRSAKSYLEDDRVKSALNRMSGKENIVKDKKPSIEQFDEMTSEQALWFMAGYFRAVDDIVEKL